MPAKLLADENIPSKAIDDLRTAGCDLLAIRETTPGIPDEEVLRIAVTQGRGPTICGSKPSRSPKAGC